MSAGWDKSMPPRKQRTARESTGANAGYEAEIWKLVDALHNNHTLSVLCGALPPKLDSGELRVKDVDRFVGERS